MEPHDDFERFRRIAQRSVRDRLSPYDQIQEGRRATYGEFLDNPYDGNIKRASSFRDKRESAGRRSERMMTSFSTTRSPASYSPHRQEGSISPHPLNIYEHRGGSGPVCSRESVDHRRPSKYDEISPLPHGSPVAGRQYRDRGGSMKEMKKYERVKAAYRPSAPAAFSSALSPANISRESHSPSRYSNVSSEDGMVKVRRFVRKKDGQILSKGDQNMPESKLYANFGSPYATRQSINYIQSVLDKTPKIYTNNGSDVSSETNGAEDNEVIEIPAITTTLIQSSSYEDYRDQTSPSPTSPNRLKPELRNRSQSWAYVPQRTTESPPSCPSPQSDNFPGNEVLTVQVLGTFRVGKTSLCMQFQTSESLDVTMDNGLDEEQTSTVVVDINGEHFNLEFVDTNMIQDDFQTNMEANIIQTADAYVVVFAIDDRSSFKAARTIVGNLLGQCKRSSAIVLVANKSDLVRTRAVTHEEGKNLAAIYDCPYFEISTSLNHRVDDLLVGIVVAIQEQRHEIEKERVRLERMAMTSKHGSFAIQGRRRSSLGLVKPPKNSLIRFLQKRFSKKEKS